MAAHIETGTMAPPLRYKSYTMNHLGVVAGMCDELGIAELIDRVIVQDSDKRTVSVGTEVGYPLKPGQRRYCYPCQAP